MVSGAVDVRHGHLRLVREDERQRRGLRFLFPGRRRAGERVRTSRTVVILLCATSALTAIGLVMVFSASFVSDIKEHGSSFFSFKRQAAYAAFGTLVLLLTSRIRFRAWQRLSVPLLFVTIALLALVLHPAAGTVAGGSARWIELGPVTIQPSELAKLAVVIFAAAILVRKWKYLDDPLHLILPLVPVVGVVAGLIMLQPDLGTTVILVASVAIVLFAAGVRLRYLLAGALFTGSLGLLLIMGEGYRRARFLAFLHPTADPLNTGYQLYQSLIALGSGGWLGVGLGAGRGKWAFVPNAHTDFIFAILGEELGLIGAIVVLLLFGVLIFTGIKVAMGARDPFGRLLAGGIVGWLGLQTLVNLGAVTGLLPVTGVPLPLVSFGGSSLVVTLAAVGILVNIERFAGETAPSAASGNGAVRRSGRRTTTRKARAPIRKHASKMRNASTSKARSTRKATSSTTRKAASSAAQKRSRGVERKPPAALARKGDVKKRRTKKNQAKTAKRGPARKTRSGGRT